MDEEVIEPTAAPITDKPDTARFRTFASLRHADFRYLWTGTVMMSAGQWVQQVTLGWLIYDLTGNSVLLGALNGLRALPFLVTGPMAGVAADRMDRRKLLIAHPMGVDRHRGLIWRPGRVALFACLAYFCCSL